MLTMSCHDQPPTHYFSPPKYPKILVALAQIILFLEMFKFLLILQEEIFMKESEKPF
jgi:hypothetical protein